MRWHATKPLAFATAGFLLVALKPTSEPAKVVISIGAEALPLVQAAFKVGQEQSVAGGEVALVEVAEDRLPALSAVMHEKFNRCGGFMVEAGGFAGAMQALTQAPTKLMSADETLYHVDQQSLITELLPQVAESSLRATITRLSDFQNRYYQSPHGVKSQKWVMESWQQLAAGRSDITVELVQHAGYQQPSVVLTWQGSQKADEVVVLGGHGDSISGWFPSPDVKAPGADDNASGIGSITEVLRVLVSSSFVPERTLKFMSYAAEEVGLKGSQDIAEQYKRAGVKVVGVMQLDMTNFAGSSHDIVLMEDHTDQGQNAFLKKLVQTYLPDVKLAVDRCGYACSDHASWTRQGYAASFPFESTMSDSNQDIHTARDTIERSGNHARHALPFAKLATAFVVELSSL